jgi:pilus assembly protein Flp/PilA
MKVNSLNMLFLLKFKRLGLILKVYGPWFGLYKKYKTLREGNMLTRSWAKTEARIKCEKGATAIEYGLIAAGIAVAISVVVFAVGSDLVALFSGIGGKIASATPG